MEKFSTYLSQFHTFFTKQEIKAHYETFKKINNVKKSFTTVFDALRKTHLTYLVQGHWALSKKDPVVLISDFLRYKNIPHYYGLHTAVYLNKRSWQTPAVFTIINTVFNQTRTVTGIRFRFMTFPSHLINEHTIISNDIPYSDPEKTVLDFLYKKIPPPLQPEDMQKLALYARLYNDRVRADLIAFLPSEKRTHIK